MEGLTEQCESAAKYIIERILERESIFALTEEEVAVWLEDHFILSLEEKQNE